MAVAVKTSAAAIKNTKNNGESSTSSDKTDSSSKEAGAGKGSRSHAKQDRNHPGKKSQMELTNDDYCHCCSVVLLRFKRPILQICSPVKMLCLAIIIVHVTSKKR